MPCINDVLPTELLDQILESYFHQTEDYRFSMTAANHPTYTGANALLACREWRQIGTPHLYELVELRSSTQTAALARTFRKKPQLASRVKHLRVEGAFGHALGEIGELCAASVECLSLSLDVRGEDWQGYERMLAKLSPRHVTILGDSEGFTVWEPTIVAVLCRSIKRWDRLEYFDFPSSTDADEYGAQGDAPGTELEYSPELCKALATRATLRTVCLSGDLMDGVFALSKPILSLLSSETAPVSRLLVRRLEGFPLHLDVESVLAAGADLKLEFIPAPYGTPIPDRCFGYIIMQQPADIYRPILERILSYAVSATPGSLQRSRKISHKSWMDTRAVDVPTALSLMETCHLFRETVLPLVTSTVRLAAVKPMHSLIAHLDEQPSTAKQIRTIVHRPIEQGQTSRAVLSMFLSFIFLQCFDAEQLATLKLDPVDDADHGPFRDMPRNLIELDVAGVDSVPNILATSQDFARLDSLRTLRWSGEREFTVTAHWPKKLRDKRLKAPSKIMPALRELDIGSCHDTFFSAMEELELPSLETLKIHQMVNEFYSGKMLLKHGPKLHTLEIAHGWKPVYVTLCPQLQVLVLHTTPPSAEQYLLPDKEAHPTLSEIRLHWYPSHNLNSSVCIDFERLVEFLAHRKKKLFPRLATIRIMHERLWPVKERDLESPWPRYAQSLKQYGMQLLDARGEQWKSA